MPPAPARLLVPYSNSLLTRSSTSKVNSHDLDARRTIAAVIGIIFGLAVIILVLGSIYHCVRRSKPKYPSQHLDDQLFGDLSDDEGGASVLKEESGIRNLKKTNMRYRGGQGEEEGCCDLFCLGCCGVTRGTSGVAKQRRTERYTRDTKMIYGFKNDRSLGSRGRSRFPGNLNSNPGDRGYGPRVVCPVRRPQNGPNFVLYHHDSTDSIVSLGGGGNSGSGSQGNHYGNYNEHGSYHTHITNILTDDRSNRATQRRASSRRYHDPYGRNRKYPQERSSSLDTASRGNGGQRRKPEVGSSERDSLPRMPELARATQRIRTPPEELVAHIRRRARSFSPDKNPARIPLEYRHHENSAKKWPLPPSETSDSIISYPDLAHHSLDHFFPRSEERKLENWDLQGDRGRENLTDLCNSDNREFLSSPGYEISPDLLISSSTLSSPSHSPVAFVHVRAQARASEAKKLAVAVIGEHCNEVEARGAVFYADDVDSIFHTEEGIGGRNSDIDNNDGKATMASPHSSWHLGHPGIELEHPGSLVDFNPSSASASSTKEICGIRKSIARPFTGTSSSSSSSTLRIDSGGKRAGGPDKSISGDSTTIPNLYPYESSITNSSSSSSSEKIRTHARNHGTRASDHSILGHSETTLSIRSGAKGSFPPAFASHTGHTRFDNRAWNSSQSVFRNPSAAASLSTHTESTSLTDLSTIRGHGDNDGTWALDSNISSDPGAASSSAVGTYSANSSSLSLGNTFRNRVEIEETWDQSRIASSDSAAISTHKNTSDPSEGTAWTWDTHRRFSDHDSEFSTVAWDTFAGDTHEASPGSACSNSTEVYAPLEITDCYSETPSRVWTLASESSSVRHVSLTRPEQLELSNLSYEEPSQSGVLTPLPIPAFPLQIEYPIVPGFPSASPRSSGSEETIHGSSPSLAQSVSTVNRFVDIITATPPPASSHVSSSLLQIIRRSSPILSEGTAILSVNPRGFVTAPSSVCSNMDDDFNKKTIISINTFMPSDSFSNSSASPQLRRRRHSSRYFSMPQIVITGETISRQIEPRVEQQVGIELGETGEDDDSYEQWLRDEGNEGRVVSLPMVDSVRSRYQATAESATDDSDATGGVGVS